MKRFFRNTVTSSDRNVISQFLLDAEKEMRECDVEMNKLKTRMHMLENKKKGLRKAVEKCRSLLAPIHRLPTEILAHIFSMACDKTIWVSCSAPRVVKLSTVCGRWRELALSTTSLWSALRIDFSFWAGRFPDLERLIRIFMDRSGGSRLRLELDFTTLEEVEACLSSIISLLVRNCARWQTVSLELDDFDPFVGLDLDGLVFSALQDLQIHIEWEAPLPPIFNCLFKNTPLLRSLDINCLEFFADEEFNLPRHQVEVLTIRYGTSDRVLTFLSSFPHLKALTLTRTGIATNHYDGHYLSSTVKTLTFTWDDQTEVDTTLPRLTLPELASLTMSGNFASSGRWPVWVQTPFTEFMARSSCTITSLCLKWLPMTDRQVMDILELMPSLNYLEIEEYPESPPNRITTEMFLQHLVVDPQAAFLSGHSFLPLLTELVLVVRKEGLVEQDVFDVVSSRWIPDPVQARELGVECLRSVRMTVMGETADKFRLSSLECYRDAGLQLEIIYKKVA
ncbi:hypothetical protein V5O48_011919 [Marasmius crinis-equi]|uniref:F-box domain-containing protein n=1 Tax=Marasmius crinis-equi TaxID=585013 RepID=A0ABR3F4A1_9AGAR